MVQSPTPILPPSGDPWASPGGLPGAYDGAPVQATLPVSSHLISKTSGAIFTWDEGLAGMPEMENCDEFGNTDPAVWVASIPEVRSVSIEQLEQERLQLLMQERGQKNMPSSGSVLFPDVENPEDPPQGLTTAEVMAARRTATAAELAARPHHKIPPGFLGGLPTTPTSGPPIVPMPAPRVTEPKSSEG